MLAGLFEVGWAVGLKYAAGFTRFWPSAWTIGSLVASFVLLASAVRTLPIGTAYAVWTGIGAVGTALVAVTLLHEPISAWRLACMACIAGGVVGLKLLS